jgi:hypothetical protein
MGRDGKRVVMDMGYAVVGARFVSDLNGTGQETSTFIST